MSAPIANPSAYDARLVRYRTAMANGRPDQIPIRPFVAEFTAKVAGMTNQEVTQDYEKAFEAARICAKTFDWDAVVPNMVYVWGGIARMLGTRYYSIPGVGIAPDTGFQYLEPPEGEEWMSEDEYPALAADPTGYLMETWLPRTQSRICKPGSPATVENQMAWLKGGMALMQYFTAFGGAVERLRTECAMPSAICGILKSPFDIIADKFRGYIGMTIDLHERPNEVMAAVEAMMPHMLATAKASADPARILPVSIWMHRGCVPFITPLQFDRFFWPTLKPIIEELWADGHQTLFYAEGKWHHHWDRLLELPESSIIVHCDRDDVFAAKKKLGHKFAISGGIPNTLLSFGKPDEVRAFCRRVINEVAIDGGYSSRPTPIRAGHPRSTPGAGWRGSPGRLGGAMGRSQIHATRDHGRRSVGAIYLGKLRCLVLCLSVALRGVVLTSKDLFENFFSPSPVRPSALSTAFTPKKQIPATR